MKNKEGEGEKKKIIQEMIQENLEVKGMKFQ